MVRAMACRSAVSDVATVSSEVDGYWTGKESRVCCAVWNDLKRKKNESHGVCNKTGGLETPQIDYKISRFFVPAFSVDRLRPYHPTGP